MILGIAIGFTLGLFAGYLIGPVTVSESTRREVQWVRIVPMGDNWRQETTPEAPVSILRPSLEDQRCR